MPEWLLVEEAADRLKLSRGRVYQLITARRLRYIMREDRMHVSAADVSRYREYQGQLKQLLAQGTPLAVRRL